MVRLFQRLCRPLATPQTRGAFLFGLRLMAVEGTTEDVPDTPANAAAIAPRGASAFPQVQGVYLVECGTHAVVDAGFWPCHTSERVAGARDAAHVGPGLSRLRYGGMVAWWHGGRGAPPGAHVLGRLPAGVKPERLRALADGSVLAYLRPSEDHRRRRGERISVRIVAYTLTDPALPGYGEVHRVITTLLNPRLAPAHAVACAYHERWEIDSPQRLVGRTLRSLTPTGVLQELYGVLLAHYALRAVMHEAALAADCDPDRLSFVRARDLVREAVPEFHLVAPEQRPQLYARLLREIAAKRLPPRRLRSNPRVVKRKMSNFTLKRAAHSHPAQPRAPFPTAVRIQPPPAPMPLVALRSPPSYAI